MPVRVTLVRHGETASNVSRQLQGQLDNHLSVNGVHQAERLGLELMQELYTRIYTSDLARAHRTLHQITKQLEVMNKNSVRHDERLRERHYGNAEGRPIAEYKARAAAHGFQEKPYLFTPPGGETYPEFLERIISFFSDIFRLADRGVDENILIVTHGSWFTACMRYFYENRDRFEMIDFNPNAGLVTPDNTGITRFTIAGPRAGKRVLTFGEINNADHLLCEGCRYHKA